MAKCSNCLSCLNKQVYYQGERYLVCTLCYNVYQAYIDHKDLVEDKDLAQKIIAQANITRVE